MNEIKYKFSKTDSKVFGKEVNARVNELFVKENITHLANRGMILKTLLSFGFYMGIFAVLVGGLGMMNSTLMSVFERTREIGVLRAVGWRRRRVIAMILGESMIVAILGGVAGIVLGIGLTELTKLSPAVNSMLDGIFTVDIREEFHP